MYIWSIFIFAIVINIVYIKYVVMSLGIVIWDLGLPIDLGHRYLWCLTYWRVFSNRHHKSVLLGRWHVFHLLTAVLLYICENTSSPEPCFLCVQHFTQGLF